MLPLVTFVRIDSRTTTTEADDAEGHLERIVMQDERFRICGRRHCHYVKSRPYRVSRRDTERLRSDNGSKD